VKTWLPFATLLFTSLVVTGPVAAQPYPVRPVRMLIGFPPGGGTDIVGRIVAQKLSENLGQQIVPENRGGATGMVAAELAARAAPDGYTIMMAHISAMSILPWLYPKMAYDTAKDFAPITLAAIGPNLLVVHPSLPVKNTKELIALAKARPGQLHYASPGSGSVQHLSGELFKLQAKVDMVHVPYKGSGQSIVDLIAGHVQLNFDAVPVVIGHARQGRLRALAVTSEKRSALLPDIHRQRSRPAGIRHGHLVGTGRAGRGQQGRRGEALRRVDQGAEAARREGPARQRRRRAGRQYARAVRGVHPLRVREIRADRERCEHQDRLAADEHRYTPTTSRTNSHREQRTQRKDRNSNHDSRITNHGI